MSRARELPLFPLSAVLFPGGPLPLRIFEPRYVDMVGRCLREGSGFAVVLLTDGNEAGEAIEFAEVGTEARIVDFDRLDDGLLGLSCVGQQRIRVLEAWRQPDGLNMGRVEDLPPDPALAIPEEYRHLAAVLQQILPQLGEAYAHVERHFGDAGWVASRLAELLPIELTDKQSLLETIDPVARLEVLAPIVRLRSH